MVLKNNCGDICGDDFSENAVSHIGVAKGVGHKYCTVEFSVIDEVIDTALTDVKGGASHHSAEACNIGDIQIIGISVGIDAFKNIVLIFLVETGNNNNDLFGLVFIHYIPLFCII